MTKFKDFELRRVEDGSPFKLKSMAGRKRPTVVLFVQSDLPACGNAANLLEEHAYSARNAGKNALFLIVHVGDSVPDAKEFSAKFSVSNCSHFVSLKPPPSAYGLSHFPHTVIIKGDGHVALSTSDDGVPIDEYL